jgi:hypothetical protein
VAQTGVAVLLLLAMAAVASTAVIYNGKIDQAARAVTTDPQIVADERFGSLSLAIMLGGLCLGLALGFGGLAIGLWRGANVARVLTAVVAGVPLLCGLCQAGGGLLLGMLLFSLPEGPPPGVVEPDLAEEPGMARYDAFYAELDRLSFDVLGTAVLAPLLTILVFLGVLAVLTLLFTPSANRFFRPGNPHRDIYYVAVPYPVYWPHPVPAPAPAPAPAPVPAQSTSA